MRPLYDVSVIVTTFLRDGLMRDCVDALWHELPECQIILADDGRRDSTNGMLMAPNKHIILPFDSGLPAKRNAAVKAATRKYCLLFCDDFNADEECSRGVELMARALDTFPDLAVAAGRVNNQPYEGYLEYVPGEYIQERRLNVDFSLPDGGVQFCDLTVNYFLARTEILRAVPWDEDLKIGGEHFQWFWDMKKAGHKVGWVKGANVNTFPYDPTKQDPEYASYRARAHSLGHRIMMKKMNVKEYRGF